MIKLILGLKGSGKTKRLMDMCNEAVAQSKGNVVFIEKGVEGGAFCERNKGSHK